MERQQKKLIQWHPAFYAGLQIELEEDADKLIFENEHTLSTKPMQIDVLIIKKNSKESIKKNIGRIFRRYNIIEYKSPEDYLSIDDFYKVYGYTCFYKASAKKQNEIPADEVTITFVCKNYPRKFTENLIEVKKIQLENMYDGIYYLIGDIFPIQLIVTSELSVDANLWLRELTNEIESSNEVNVLVNEYSKHEHDELYKSVMNVIVNANNEKFQEAKSMCEALRELFKDELVEKYEDGFENGINKGISQNIETTIEMGKSFGGTREAVKDIIMKKMNLSEEKAENYMELYW